MDYASIMVKARINELCKQRGITSAYQLQHALALKSPNQAIQWFNDELSGISFATMDKLCDFFECEPGDLFKREPELESQRTRAAKKTRK